MKADGRFAAAAYRWCWTDRRMAATPLSDLITAVVESPTEESVGQFMTALVDARLGLVATRLPAGYAPGQTFQARKGELEVQVVFTPDGRRMIKACADPTVFEDRFPGTAISALIEGREALSMLKSAKDIDGILVCSAASAHSMPVTKEDAERALATPSERPTPWWGKMLR